jgi:hypothetical protein
MCRLNAEIFGIRAGGTCSYHWSRKRYTQDDIRTVSTLQDQQLTGDLQVNLSKSGKVYVQYKFRRVRLQLWLHVKYSDVIFFTRLDEYSGSKKMFGHKVLGAFAKLRKATISFAMSVRPSVRPSVRMEQLSSHWTDFMNFDFERFFEICRANRSLIKIWQALRLLYLNTYVNLWYLA